jgi:hypothetical protein
MTLQVYNPIETILARNANSRSRFFRDSAMILVKTVILQMYYKTATGIDYCKISTLYS